MAEVNQNNVQAFEPYNGGDGARMSAGTGTGNVAIPGLEGGSGSNNDKRRVLITNEGGATVYIRMGNASVTALLTSSRCGQAIMPGTQMLLKPPDIGPQPVYMAAITAAGTVDVSVCSGVGT